MAECDTAACAAGHIVCAAIELGETVPDDFDIAAAAKQLVGLTAEPAGVLFLELDNDEARAALARAAETGSWNGLTR